VTSPSATLHQRLSTNRNLDLAKGLQQVTLTQNAKKDLASKFANFVG